MGESHRCGRQTAPTTPLSYSGYTSLGMEPMPLDRAIGVFRKWLAIPLESTFHTADDLHRLPPPPRPPGPVPVPAQRSAVITQGFATFELSPEARQEIIHAIRQPERLLLTIRQGSPKIPPFVLPVVFVISPLLTSAEREHLRRQQTAQLAYFDKCIGKTRAVLLQLTDEGANPLFILSILLRYALRGGTVFPSPRTARLSRSQFALGTPLPWLKPGGSPEPVRLTAQTTLAAPSPVRRRGPAGIGANVGMALLANHLQVATKRRGPHATEIAALFRVWGDNLSRLNRERVYRRIKRVQEEHSRDFHRLVLNEARQMPADRVFFERFAQS